MLNYFVDEVEYPGASLFNGLVANTFYCYINSWFVQGALCLVGRQGARAWLLERYEVFDPGRFAAVEQKLAQNSCRRIDWAELDDDVILLVRGKEPDEWWLFWFDSDVSDCSLGRFQTTDNVDTIATNIDRWIDRLTDHTKAGTERTDADGNGWETLSAWRRLPNEWAARLQFSR